MKARIAAVDDAVRQIESLVVNTLLDDVAARQFADGAIAKNALLPYVPHILNLSKQYVSDRTHSIKAITPPDQAMAYALYFLPINFAKIFFLLHELPEEFKLRKLSILDFGSGPGTGALAAASFFDISPRVTLIDHSAAMLSVAERLLKARNVEYVTKRVSSFALPAEKFDVIIAANALSELPESQQLEPATQLLECLNPGGVLLLLEPALRSTTQATMRLRDALLEKQQNLAPLFPCPRRDACPMLKTEPENWCHGTLSWEAPPLVSQLDELCSFNKHRIKYTAFVLQLNGVVRPGLRILETSERKKYGFEFSLCAPNEFGTTVLSKKSPEELKLAVSRARQFELVAPGAESLESACKRSNSVG